MFGLFSNKLTSYFNRAIKLYNCSLYASHFTDLMVASVYIWHGRPAALLLLNSYRYTNLIKIINPLLKLDLNKLAVAWNNTCIPSYLNFCLSKFAILITLNSWIFISIFIAFEKKGSRRRTKNSITLIFILSYFLKNKFELTIFMTDICDKQRQNCPSKTKKN